MASRIVNVLLAAAIAVGIIATIVAARQHRALQDRHAALAAEYGLLKISDPTMIHLVALNSQDPLHFRWRIYVPPKCKLNFRHNLGRNTGLSDEPREFIAHVRFRFQGSSFEVYAKQDMGATQTGIGSAELVELLKERRNDVTFDQLGQGAMVIVDPDEVQTLLTVRMNDALAAHATKVLPENNYGLQSVPTLFTEEIGTDEAFAKRARAIQSASTASP